MNEPAARVTGRLWLARVLWHVRLDALLLALVCLVDSLVTTHGANVSSSTRWLTALSACGLGAWLGVIVGSLQGVLLEAAMRLPSPFRLESRLDEALSRTGERPRVVRFHALALAFVASGSVALAAFDAFLGASARIKEPELQTRLIVLVAGVSIAVTVVGGALVLPVVERALGRLDRRVRLPVPAGAPGRNFLFLVLPTLWIAVPLFVAFGIKLGVFMHVLFVACFLVSIRFLDVSLESLKAWGTRRAGVVGRVITSLALVGHGLVALLLVTSLVILGASEPAAQWVRRGAAVPFVTEVLQGATDVDRDGASSAFGGRDCAPLDAARSPVARDVPNNGVDEDCDGTDSLAAGILPLYPPFSDQLSDSERRRFNVLWYVVDSLRADHLPIHGYGKNTSPTLTRLARESWVFDRVLAQSSNTSLSMPSMLTGRWPASLAWKRSYYPVSEKSNRTLPEVLTAQGYFTGLLMNDWVKHKLPGIQHGFQHHLAAPAKVNWKSSPTLLSMTIDAMSQAAKRDQPFFLVVHLDDVHHPYQAQAGYAVPSFPNADPEVEKYDKGIALFDQTLAFMLAHLENQGLSDDTVVVVTADHGEEFLEHGGTIHSRTCYVESVHVPLVIRVPGQKAQRSKAPVPLIDVVPTLLELLGLESGSLRLDGQSLLVPLRSKDTVDPERPIFCSIFQMLGGRQNFFTQTVRSGSWLLVHEKLGDTVELYDTRVDPREQTNLVGSGQHAERVKRLRELVEASLTGNLFEARTFQ